jgi:hypothetical protein
MPDKPFALPLPAPGRARRTGLLAALGAAAVLAAWPACATEPAPQWAAAHDGGALFNDDGYRVVCDPQGNAVVAGESADGVGGVDLAVRKLARDDGHEIWHTRYQGYDDKDVAVTDITWDTAGQLLVAGFIRGCVG